MRRYNSKPQTRMTAAHTRHIWAWPRGHMGMGTSIRHRWTYEDVPPCSHCVQPVTTHSSTRIDTERCTLAQTLKPLLSRRSLSLSLSAAHSLSLPLSSSLLSRPLSLPRALLHVGRGMLMRAAHIHMLPQRSSRPRRSPPAPKSCTAARRQHVASTSPARRHRPDTSVRLLTPPACVLLLASSPQGQAPRPPWQAFQTHPSGGGEVPWAGGRGVRPLPVLSTMRYAHAWRRGLARWRRAAEAAARW